MSDMFHNNDIADECLPESRMFDYIDGKLSAKERHLVEKHLLTCELCRDAMEGLSLVKNRNVLKQSEDQINEYLQRPVKKEARVISLWSKNKTRLAIAASIILVAGIMMILKFSMEQESLEIFSDNLAVEKNPEIKTSSPVDSAPAEPKKKISNESEKINTVKNTSPSSDKSLDRSDEDPLVKQAIRKEDRAIASATNSVVAEPQNKNLAVKESPAQERAEKIAEAKDEESYNSASTAQPSAAAPIMAMPVESDAENQGKTIAGKGLESFAKVIKAKKRSTASAPSVSPSAASQSYQPEPVRIVNDTTNDADYMNAMKFYRQENFSAALIFFQRFLAKKPYQPNALLYNSISQLNVGKTEEALINLEKVLQCSNPALYDPAKYYKALIFIKKNERKKARNLLEEVIRNNGEYKQRATDTLQDMD